MEHDQSPQSWARLWETFHKAREADPSERALYLNQLELADPELFHKVKELLFADEKSGELLEDLVAQEFDFLEEKSEAPDLLSGQLLAGRFRILRQLGKGGMGTVYEGLDEELGSKVAMKMMRRDLALDPAARERFHREINLARQITHPNACRIFDLFRHEDLLFLTMELLEGETLHEKIRRDGPFNPSDAMSIVLQVSQALTAIHNSGIVHRDFKSSNILLVPQEKGVRAVVTDFGLATTLPGRGSLHVTETGQVFGTPEFMAPEQLTKGSITAATDVYALGLVLYEMLTGKLPLEGESPLTIAAKRISEDVPTPRAINPDIDRIWERVILRCLERNPSHRFQTANEVEAALRGEAITMRVPFFPARHRTRVLSFILILMMCLFAGLYFWMQRSRTSVRSDVVSKRLWSGATGLPAGVLSSDGKILIDIDWQTADLIAIELDTGEKQRLTNSGSFFVPGEFESYPLTTALSNDGKRVAYSNQYSHGRGWDLKIVDIDKGDVRTLYSSQNIALEPSTWSPKDGEILTLMKDRKGRTTHIALFSVQDGSHRILKSLDSENVRKMSFSPDGRYVIYDYQAKDSTNYDLFLLSVKNRNETALVSHPANDFLLGWNPGVDQVVFASDRSGTDDAWLLRVADGKPQGVPERTRKDIGQIYPLKLTADGSFYYVHLLTSADIYIASLKEKTAVKMVQGVSGSNKYAEFSPDGKSMLFHTVRDPVRTRWAFTPVSVLRNVFLDTNREADIPYQLKWVGGITRWSKDGRSILVHGDDPAQIPGLYKIDVETGHPTILIPNKGDSGATQYDWTSDGTGLFYIMDSGNAIWRKDLVTGMDQKIHSGATNFALSKDGLSLAVTKVDVHKGFTDVSIVPTTGGNARKILTLRMPEFISVLTWAPNGREIVFAKGRRDLIDQPQSLWSVPVSGGKPKELGIRTEYVQLLSFHPDGQRIAISAYADTGEVWVIQNFLQQGINQNLN